ncbi:hypothetical protein WG908_03810 [Sphingobium sp. AN641]|uniref:hypothetical protein n=1 Tax=Sphingobium sp. AN641 TaxID=3133443 RepID=UPI0030C59FB0
MTPPRSFVGTITGLRWLSHFRARALVFGLPILLFALLSVFPERHRAAVTLTPTDPQSLGLSGTLGQLGAINNVFGNQAAVEIALRVGKSYYVRNIVIDRTKLDKRLGKDRLALHRWLDRQVDIRSLRGGIILIEMQRRDGALARDIVAAYATAIQERLGQISRTQTAYKRGVLRQLVSEASGDLAQAQAAYDAFRLRNRNPSPLAEAAIVTDRIMNLESAIKAKQIALETARQLYTDDNVMITQIKAEIVAIRRQLEEVKGTQSAVEGTVGNAVAQSSQLFKLERELGIQRALYDSYLRFLEGTAVENLTSSANVRILEPPFVDSERQIWWPAAAVAIALAMLWAAIEFYRLRPPVGARVTPEAS